MATDYGSGIAAPLKEGRLRRANPAFVAAAAIALFCLGAIVHYSSSVSPYGREDSLVSVGGLGKEAKEFQKIESTVRDEMNQNEDLTNKFHGTFGSSDDQEGVVTSDDSACHCNCRDSPSNLKAKAATMLAQVGEDVFFGPCGGCPCMRVSNLDATVRELSDAMKGVTKEEKKLAKEEQGHIPVDIDMQVGQKGKPGAPGPKGYPGSEGPAGPPGIPGPTGPKGPRGQTGRKGDRGPKGPDGFEGANGPQGEMGMAGPPGLPGPEGQDGKRGRQGPPGRPGQAGPNGATGAPGPRGPNAPAVGKPGPVGQPGPPGPPGDKGAIGPVGPVGYVGANGPDGAPGMAGARGHRGEIGKGCDGYRPTNGWAPKVIDACGICGGDESECAVGRSASTAYAVGDPHYHTYDGQSFDYQMTGEFILSRHMSDIELQNHQRQCPNGYPRCNIMAAIITKNQNIQFKSEWTMTSFMVNGRMWRQGQEYQWDVWYNLDPYTWVIAGPYYFKVWFNDIYWSVPCVITGYMYDWGPPLPNNKYMNLYMQAPGRWSSGLSMTGLFANFNFDWTDDWRSISPSTTWWVAGTQNSAFQNPDYRLEWGNRIVQTRAQKVVSGAISLAIKDGESENFKSTDWTLEDEKNALKAVDPLTARMRRKLFKKMAKDGAILRTVGEAKPSGLGAAELDIEEYKGENPSRYRILQQALFRKEWKVLTPKMRNMMMLKVESNNAAGKTDTCKSCMKDDEADCASKGITEKVGIRWKSEQSKKDCQDQCVPWLPAGSWAQCSCYVDCSHDTPIKTCVKNAVKNYAEKRQLAFVVPGGDDQCVELDVAEKKVYKAAKWKEERWKDGEDKNFLVSFWWRPQPKKSFKDDGEVRNIIYKGQETVPSTIQLAIGADVVGNNPAKIAVTVGGMTRSSVNKVAEKGFTFIAVSKQQTKISIWLGLDGKVVLDSSFDLGSMSDYVTHADDAFYLVMPGAKEKRVPFGWVGKVSYYPASAWSDEAACQEKDAECNEWRSTVEANFANGEPTDCGTDT